MLTRDEMSLKIIPNNNGNNTEDTQSPSSSNLTTNNKNLVIKTSFKGKPIQMYLPISNPIHTRLKTIEHKNVISLRKSNLSLPPIPSKKLDYRTIASSNAVTQKHIDAYADICSKLKYTLNTADPNDSKTNTNQHRRKQHQMKFNLQHLMRKVKSIIHGDKNYKKNYDQINEYKNKMLSLKKSSKPLDDLYMGEVSNHQLHLQKLILNVEYDNVFKKGK